MKAHCFPLSVQFLVLSHGGPCWWVSSCPVDLWNSALAMGPTNLTTLSKSRSLESSIMQQVCPETGCACPHTGREQYLSPADAILATLPHVGNEVRDSTARDTVHISTSDKHWNQSRPFYHEPIVDGPQSQIKLIRQSNHPSAFICSFITPLTTAQKRRSSIH